MKDINKQQVGFKFGTNPTKLIDTCGEVSYNGRKYRLVMVEASGLLYYSLRLYNAKGKFIKQFMFEPGILNDILNLFFNAAAQRRVSIQNIKRG